ncbi:MAG: DUF5117 domain-containing protein [Acidobacteria bacterium]|nr:DUF5117 domain-containing protein [Acidobacteriota bacterium]MBW4045119.1 DUF5117 domain-containing protein [Acidobacteriota bacterium]
MPRLRTLLAACLFALTCSLSLAGQNTIAEKTSAMKHLDGLFPLDWDAKSGKLYLEIGSFSKDFLLLDSLPYGVGSNDLGLDRGQLGRSHVVHFYRSGPHVLLIEKNLAYRSSSSEPEEQLDVQQSFAQSVLWGFKVEAEDNDKVLVDATDFFLHDSHGVAERLVQARQGAYKLDPTRSTIAMEATKNFPLNTEVDSILTFTADGPMRGKLVASVTPDPHAVTVHEHTSLIQLPDDGYQPRAFDPRAGYFDIQYRDYSAPLGAPMDVHLITRHWLQKKDPGAALSEPVKPIIYYVDRGAPEPIRSALVEGANWWNQAFEAAGFKNAFQVKVLPEGADPMDIRYNMIQWVHRSTRGWSYGDSVIDPRTGEIIKGQVTLGSLRARQDYLIAEALLSPYQKGKPISSAMKELVLARIRQLAAHETGHTLGLAHNFAASSIAAGTSVMDYPHPWITLDSNGRPDLSHAYTTGIGAWDKIAIQYGYSQFPTGTDTHKALDAILSKALSSGLYFITDEDSRPLGSANPYSHLWDNGHDPAVELDRLLTVRTAALKHFGEDAIQPGEPMAQLEDTLVPLYLLHRYQTEAAAKELGGVDYRYALRGDNQMVTKPVSAADQQRALAAVLRTLSPDVLTLPASLLQMLPPRPPGYPRTQESFQGHTGLTFDPEGAVESAADLTNDLLFNPDRAARLVEEKQQDTSLPGLEDVIEATLKATWYAPRLAGLEGETQLTVEDSVLRHLLSLAAAPGASPEAKAVAAAESSKLADWLKGRTNIVNAPPLLHAHWSAALAQINAFNEAPAKFATPSELEAPPGQPIGEDDF